jgi:hypothetical protein
MDSNIKLKAVNTKELEDAIARIVTELTGWDYTCTINTVQYGNVGDAEITLLVKTSDWLKINLEESS